MELKVKRRGTEKQSKKRKQILTKIKQMEKLIKSCRTTLELHMRNLG